MDSISDANAPPPSLPSTSNPTTVQITSSDEEKAVLSTTSTSAGSATHQFYKPRARTASLTAQQQQQQRRSRTESLTSPGSATVSRAPSLTNTRAGIGGVPHHQAATTGTHTGNILAPASFYRPSRPNTANSAHPPTNQTYALPAGFNSPLVSYSAAQAQYNGRTTTGAGGGSQQKAGAGTGITGGHVAPRPSSGISTASSSMGGGVPLMPSSSFHGQEHGLMMLPITHVHSRLSDGSSGPDSSPSSKSRKGGAGGAKVKHSREQLLPIREKSDSSIPRHQQHGKSSPSLTNVRESIERMWRRTTSTERDRNLTDDTGVVTAGSTIGRLPTTIEHVPSSKGHTSTSQASPTEHGPFAHTLDLSSTTAKHDTSTQPQQRTYLPTRPVSSGTAPIQQKAYGPQRNWEVYPSKNTWFFQGRLLTGGDSPWAFLFSLSVLFAIAGVWFGTTCIWWWNNESPAVAAVGAYMCLLTIASMLATAMRDPGIIPRDLDPDPPYDTETHSDGRPAAPLPRQLFVRGGIVRVKYCTTCETYRPPRCSHCKLCDNCVDGCDHHCPWVNNCIGRRNYTSFFIFLLSANLTLLLVIITSALHIWLLIKKEIKPDFQSSVSAAPGSVAAFVMSVLVIGPVAALFLYHVRLMLLNITTIEQVHRQAHRSVIPGPLPPNYYTLNTWYRNLGYLMCRPVTLSWIEPHAYVLHDQRLPNPGYGMEWTHDLEAGHNDITAPNSPMDAMPRRHEAWQDVPIVPHH